MSSFKSSSIGNGFYFGSVKRCLDTGRWLAFIHEEIGDRFGLSKRLIGTLESRNRAERLVQALIRSWSSGDSFADVQSRLWWSEKLQERIWGRKYD